MSTTGPISIPLLPCDRGIKSNVTSRGWHHFQASPNGVICCIYCGAQPEASATATGPTPADTRPTQMPMHGYRAHHPSDTR